MKYLIFTILLVGCGYAEPRPKTAAYRTEVLYQYDTEGLCHSLLEIRSEYWVAKDSNNLKHVNMLTRAFENVQAEVKRRNMKCLRVHSLQ